MKTKIEVTGKNGKTYTRYVDSVNVYEKSGYAIAFVNGSRRQYSCNPKTGLWTYTPFNF
jgi:hypothetical protein